LRDDGLTKKEGRVMDALEQAWNHYSELPEQHPQDIGEFLVAIHRAQDLLAARICRREFPHGWATWRKT
jgi:hypothetical protein